MGEEQIKHDDTWGLSLSLSLPINNLDKKPMFKREPHFSSDEQIHKMHRSNKALMIMPSMMEVDVKPQLVIDLEEVEMSKVGSPNSTVSSNACKRVGGFRGDRDVISDEEEGGTGSGGGGSNGEGERKKLRLSKDQTVVLEQAFREHTTLNTKQKMTLARQVNLRPRQVEVWFQNRRARTKLKQTEVDCEYLRRYCETLTEQNRKLQKEVQELRALKVSPDQSLMQGKNHHPGATLNMCPSCKTVSLPSSSASTSKTPTSEAGCYRTGILHRPVPLNLNKLSLTINNNRIYDSHHPRA